jgi:hypothetical protein
MLAWLLLAQVEGASLAGSARAAARWVDPPQQVELGVPFELVLEIEHRSGDAPALAPGALASDPAWAVLEGGVPLALPDLDDPARRVSEVRWTVVALEPGTLDLPEVELSYPAPEGGEALPVAIAGGRAIEVSGVLADGEDAPRPLPPDLGVDEPARARGWVTPALWSGGLALLGALAFLFIFIARRARARPVPAAPPPTPRERLAALEESALDDPEAVRAAHVELTRALREHFDGDRTRAALTDEEWLEALRQPADGELARLFAECRPVEYGGERPTHWATRERVARARALVGASGGAP